MDHLLAKNMMGVTDNIEILQTNSFGCVLKKAQNNFFVSDPIHCENGI